MPMMTMPAARARAISRPSIDPRIAIRLFLLASLPFVFAPLAALMVSFLSGGVATAEVLFAYVFGFLLNAPLVLVGLAICAAGLTVSQMIHHGVVKFGSSSVN